MWWLHYKLTKKHFVTSVVIRKMLRCERTKNSKVYGYLLQNLTLNTNHKTDTIRAASHASQARVRSAAHRLRTGDLHTSVPSNPAVSGERTYVRTRRVSLASHCCCCCMRLIIYPLPTDSIKTAGLVLACGLLVNVKRVPDKRLHPNRPQPTHPGLRPLKEGPHRRFRK